MADDPTMPIATAATSWQDGNGLHLRVYSTDGYKVEERCFDNGAWTTSNFSASGSAVSATSYLNGSSASIRVYCTFQDKTTEWCQDDGAAWYVGGYTVT